MPDPNTLNRQSTVGHSEPADLLASLHHMSTTAGLLSRDYVAVNNTAVAAALFGVASSLALFASLLLVIPIVGVIVAIVAWVQISRSNGTETGKVLAAGGFLLSAAFAGGMITVKVTQAARVREDTRQISAVVSALGQELASNKFPQAYERFDIAFRERVREQAFTQTFSRITLGNAQYLGAFKGLRWNGITPEYEKVGNGAEFVWIEAILDFDQPDQRLKFVLRKSGDRWYIFDIPDMFPTKAPGR